MRNVKTVLAIDCAQNACAAGLYCGQKDARAARSEIMAAGQGERLMPMIIEVMKDAGVEFEGLDAIVTTIGPGAFTGLRIGLSAAKGLALALDIGLYGITNLQAVAAQYAAENKPRLDLAVIIETKRDDFYFQTFTRQGGHTSMPLALNGAQIAEQLKMEPAILLGDGAARFVAETAIKSPVESNYAAPNPGFLARAMVEASDRDAAESIFTHNPEPLYLRGADVTSPKTPPRKIENKSFA